MIAIFVSNYGMVLELQDIRRCIRGGRRLFCASENVSGAAVFCAEDVSGVAEGCPQSAESAVSRH